MNEGLSKRRIAFQGGNPSHMMNAGGDVPSVESDAYQGFEKKRGAGGTVRSRQRKRKRSHEKGPEIEPKTTDRRLDTLRCAWHPGQALQVSKNARYRAVYR